MRASAAAAIALVLAGCSPSAGPDVWIEAFGYGPDQVHEIAVGDFGYPYVPVTVAGSSLRLPFDTGNMAGVSLSSEAFDRLELSSDRTATRLNSAGEVVGTSRVASSVEVSVLGHDLGSVPVLELSHADLDGLIGPAFVGDGHFTLDYASRTMAIAHGPGPETVPGFRSLPLVRSERHPPLILVRGTIAGRSVLLELDTGKSRTVVNPGLAAELGLEEVPRGVRIESLRIGGLSFEIPSARPVDQTGIDPGLADPILAGVGSDVLSRFVWTVDYVQGMLWIPDPDEIEESSR